jgi:hypothetical protein
MARCNELLNDGGANKACGACYENTYVDFSFTIKMVREAIRSGWKFRIIFVIVRLRSAQMGPLSDVLSLLKLRSYRCGGFDLGGAVSMQFQKHDGIKCYALVSGQCWLAVEGVPDAVQLNAGDCFLLPGGRPFRLASGLALTPVDALKIFAAARNGARSAYNGGGDCFMVGGHFALTANQAGILVGMLPPIVHIRIESDKAVLRWSLERMMQELREPRPGGAATRPHDAGAGTAASSGGRVERRRRVALRPRG